MSRTDVTLTLTAVDLAGAELANVHPYPSTALGFPQPARIALYVGGVGRGLLVWLEDDDNLGAVTHELRRLADRIDYAVELAAVLADSDIEPEPEQVTAP